MIESALPGVNVLLIGPTGTGKTHSIGTLVDTGITVVAFMFEAGRESLLGYYTDRGLKVPANLKFVTVKQPTASWAEMAASVKQVNQLSYEALKKTSDPARAKYDQFEQFLRTFVDVVTDDGEKLGPIDSWGTDKAAVFDGLTGMGVAAKSCIIGGKLDMDQKDWGLAQNMIENTLRKLCDACRCHVVVLAHVEREPDPLGGASKITVSTLGAKLAPKIPPMFSDVVLTARVGREYFWDTENALADLKTRNLPVSAKNPPDFGRVIEKWKSRGGVV